jgi:hypothetical protein
MSLLPNDWLETAQVFVDSVEHVLANTSRISEDAQAKLNKFVYSLVLAEKAYMITSPKGMQHVIEIVFEDEVIRDFVLTLGFTFYARWGATRARYGSLVESLAFAVSADTSTPIRGSDGSFIGTPRDILDLLPGDNVEQVLQQNKWLVTLLMIQLFVLVPEPPKPGKRNVQDQARQTGKP